MTGSAWRLLATLFGAGLLAVSAASADEPASTDAGGPPASAASAARPPASRPVLTPVPRVTGRLRSADIGLVINTADPYSVEVGEFYAKARKLKPAQVLRVQVPLRATLSPEEFEALRKAIDAHFGSSTQALALAWSAPYAVSCNSITGALTLGFDPAPCQDGGSSCAPTRPSPYFNTASIRPYAGLGVRPSMLIAAKDVAGAKALIERGIKSDGTLGLRGVPAAHAYFFTTSDRARSVRSPLFPPSGTMPAIGVAVHHERKQEPDPVERVVLFQTGATHVAKLENIGWLPGALADHLTSFGGLLDGRSGQMSATEWIAAGATASYGTVSEPCSHPQKFPHPQVLLLNYVQGATAIEAYWKSVAWPQQGVFIGEPLAAPFARR